MQHKELKYSPTDPSKHFPSCHHSKQKAGGDPHRVPAATRVTHFRRLERQALFTVPRVLRGRRGSEEWLCTGVLGAAHQLASFTFSVPLLEHLTSRPRLATITHRPEGLCIFCILFHTCTKRIKTLGLGLLYSYKPMSAKKKKDIIQCTLFLRL